MRRAARSGGNGRTSRRRNRRFVGRWFVRSERRADGARSAAPAADRAVAPRVIKRRGAGAIYSGGSWRMWAGMRGLPRLPETIPLLDRHVDVHAHALVAVNWAIGFIRARLQIERQRA